MKKPNVLFVQVPSEPFASIMNGMENNRNILRNISFPLGILYLSSYLKAFSKVGEVGLLDYMLYVTRSLDEYDTIDELIDSEAEKNLTFEPDVIALSMMFSLSFPFFKRVLVNLKKRYPNATVVVGGIHATARTDHVLALDGVDYVVRGEGEDAFKEFIDALADGRPIDIPGVNKKGQKPYTSAGVIEDLDTIPFPDWELLETEFYIETNHGRQYSEHKGTAALVTTRGCPFMCVFCSQRIVHGRKMRYRNIDSVIEEMMLLHERYDVDYFSPMDDLFTAKKPRCLELLGEIKKLDIPNLTLQFPNALSIATTDEEIVDAMRECGVESSNFAIESGTDYMQKTVVRKKCNLEKARRLVKYSRESGLITRCNFIFGFPGETKDMMQETVSYMKSIEPDWYNIYQAIPLVGTEMYDQFVASGAIEDNEDTWGGVTRQDRNFDTNEVTAAELSSFTYRLNLELNFLNNPNIAVGSYDRARMLFKEILFHYPFQIFAWYAILQANRKDDSVSDDETEIFDTIINLVHSDVRAEEIFYKHADLLPEPDRMKLQAAVSPKAVAS